MVETYEETLNTMSDTVHKETTDCSLVKGRKDQIKIKPIWNFYFRREEILTTLHLLEWPSGLVKTLHSVRWGQVNHYLSALIV